MKDLQIEKEHLEIALKSSVLPVTIERKSATVSTEETKAPVVPAPEQAPHPMMIDVSTAENVVSMMQSTVSAGGKSSGLEDSACNPFAEDMMPSKAGVAAVPEVPYNSFTFDPDRIEYIIPIRTTYQEKTPERKMRETLEFAAALYSVSEGRVLSTFHSFVRPTLSAKLTEKEINVLHLSQEVIDGSPDLAKVLADFDSFIKSSVFFLKN